MVKRYGTRVLITGASGLLGKYLTRTAPCTYNVVGTCLTTLLPGCTLMDLTNHKSVMAMLDKVQPNAIIHCAAIGSVDYCEQHHHEAYDVNVQPVKWLTEWARANGAKVVFISTNAVFDGEHPPYAEDDERNPVNIYGRLKVEAEDIVRGLDDHIIVRPIMLYGFPYKAGRSNWATRVLAAIGNGYPLKVVDDVTTQPTYAKDVADVIWELLSRVTGTYHVATSDAMTLYDFAVSVVVEWCGTQHVDDNLLPAKSNDFPQIAPRPADTTYCLDKLWAFVQEHRLNVWPKSVSNGLRCMKYE